MDKYLKLLQFDKVIEILSKYAISQLGKERCFNIAFYNDKKTIDYNQNLTQEAVKIINNLLNFPLENIFDLDDAFLKLKQMRTIEIYQIINIAKTLQTSRKIKMFFKKNNDKYGLLRDLSLDLYSNFELEIYIFNIFDSNLNVRDEASEKLKSLRQSLKDTEINISHTISTLLNDSNFNKYLQSNIYTYRNDRIVFQVKAENKNKIEGIVHDTSLSLQTFFIEPKILVDLSNKKREIENAIEIEIEKILHAVSLEIGKYCNQIINSNKLLIEFDFIFAKAKYAKEYDLVKPDIVEEKVIDLKKMANPILLYKNREKVVRNDFFMEEKENVMVITGSNTGGKTVILKTVGLCVLMAKAGLAICCCPDSGARIFPFEYIFCDIGDQQDILQNLSTFSANLKNIINITNTVNEKSLVLLDEIASGTDPIQGSALSQSLLEFFQQKGAFCICTTHLGHLKTLAYTKPGFKNASVEFDINTLSPTYKLSIGLAGLSYAIEVAKKLGLDYNIIQRADTLLKNHNDDTADIIEKLQQTQQNISSNQTKLDLENQLLQKLKTDYENKINQFKLDKKHQLYSFKKKYEGLLFRSKRELKNILNEIKDKKSQEKISQDFVLKAYSDISKNEKTVRKIIAQDIINLDTISKKPDFSTLKVGDKVLIKDLNQQAVLAESIDMNCDTVKLNLGNIKMSVKKDRLVKFDKNILPKVYQFRRYRPSNKTLNLTSISLPTTLDLRGYRVDEALEAIDYYFDKAKLANLHTVSIIHGKGTGALKSAVIDYLKHCSDVAKYRFESNEQRNEGLVIVDLY